MTLGDMQVDVLSRLLDVTSLRHRTIAHNVANVNSPGYRQMDVAFEDTFTKRLSRGDLAGAMKVREAVVEGQGGAERADGNNVDIDLEMGQLNNNTLLYRTVAQLLNARLAVLRSAISGH